MTEAEIEMNVLLTTKLPVVGDVKTGSWITREAWILARSLGKTIPYVPDRRFQDFNQYALCVCDNSMNLIAREGEYAICAEVPTDHKWKEGDIVVVVCRRDGGSTLEVTLKQISVTEDQINLWPRSDNPSFQSPIKLYDDECDFVVDMVALVIAKSVTVEPEAQIVVAQAQIKAEPASALVIPFKSRQQPESSRILSGAAENLDASTSTKKPHDRLRAARIAAGYQTRGEFADKHGIVHVTYHSHETGRRPFNMGDAQKYAKALGVTLQWLLLGVR